MPRPAARHLLQRDTGVRPVHLDFAAAAIAAFGRLAPHLDLHCQCLRRDVGLVRLRGVGHLRRPEDAEPNPVLDAEPGISSQHLWIRFTSSRAVPSRRSSSSRLASMATAYPPSARTAIPSTASSRTSNASASSSNSDPFTVTDSGPPPPRQRRRASESSPRTASATAGATFP